jgi:hypothetical protein
MPSDTLPPDRSNGRRKLLVLISVWVLTIIAALPALLRWTAIPKADSKLVQYLGYAVVAAICAYIYRHESRHLTRSRAFVVVFLVFLLTCIVNSIHRVFVDNGVPYLERYVSNVLWQGLVNDLVIQLSPYAIPHSYRFLPNAIVRWFQLGGLAFEPARDLYRLIFGILLFYAIYKYARLYTNYLGAIMAMLFIAVIYPVSFEYYAGQLTDPLSHLSFVLAFIFLETEDFALLLTTLLIGSLAKETVLALAGYYVLFRRQDTHYWWKAITLCVASAAIFMGVRMLVLHGGIHQYTQISVAPRNMPSLNWHDSRWPLGLLLTVGAFIPFLVLSWRTTPRSLKYLALYLSPVLFLSGLFFSFLVEMRNFMPLVFVLAVITARYLSGSLISNQTGLPGSPHDSTVCAEPATQAP